jgi:hypothetical protein
MNETWMRRALASFLLAVFSFPLIAPAIFADTESQLPECCRRVGKHRCAMTMDESPSDGVSLRSMQPRCPLYRGALSTPAGRYAAILKTSGAIFGAIVSHAAIQLQVEAGYRVSFSRSSQKRGPPVVLS